MTRHRKDTAPLPPVELARLRREVACLGCGAFRVGERREGKPVTRISHERTCEVWAREIEERRQEELRARVAGWEKRRSA